MGGEVIIVAFILLLAAFVAGLVAAWLGRWAWQRSFVRTFIGSFVAFFAAVMVLLVYDLSGSSWFRRPTVAAVVLSQILFAYLFARELRGSHRMVAALGVGVLSCAALAFVFAGLLHVVRGAGA
jgi:hypothetical protein